MIFSNNGERCTAGSRIFVQKTIYSDFVERFTARARRILVGDPMDPKTIVGPMISPAHLAKVRSYIELGPKEGATLLTGGIDAPDPARRDEEGQLRAPDGIRRREEQHAHRAGGDLRPGRLSDPFR